MRIRLIGLLLALSGCGASPRHAATGTSTLDYAYYRPEVAIAGPLGRLEALRLGYANDFPTLRICVETAKTTLTDRQLLLEVKLAYASWLDAAGGYGEADWARFRFVGQTHCDPHDQSFSGFVVLVDERANESTESLGAGFSREHISCTNQGGFRTCNANGVVIGWGGPGQLTYWYQGGDRSRWSQISGIQPANTFLSPYLHWLPLDEDIRRNTAAGLDPARKQTLLDEYHRLVADPVPTLVELSSFAHDLAGANLTSADDPVFPRLVSAFGQSGAPRLEQDYASERGAFSTILHEIGHQLGMDHAHCPGRDSISGRSGTAQAQNADGQWVTDIAAMAYGLPYTYLTIDDQAGIRADRDAIRQYLSLRR